MKLATNILIYFGLLLVCAGVAMPLFVGVQGIMFKIIFTAGAVTSLAGRLMERCDSPWLRVKRLMRLQVWSSVFFCAAAFFVWYSRTTTDWLAFTLAGGAVLAYVSIALPIVQNKAARDAQQNHGKD